MLTYQVRKRLFRLSEGSSIKFPNNATVEFTFRPLQPFGLSPTGGRTSVRGVAATAIIDRNTGAYEIQSEKPLEPLSVIIKDMGFGELKLQGNALRVSRYCLTHQDLLGLVESFFFVIPMLLNVEFADPPVVGSVSGKIGDVPFIWDLASWKMQFETTTQEKQEQKVVTVWENYKLVVRPSNRRLVAALHYFHIACRLSRAGHAPWEFMSEIILNLSKVLEVMFPPMGNVKPRDAVRSGLFDLGFTEEEIEKNFLPAMAIRNEIDTGHVQLSMFTQEQLQILHKFTEVAEFEFRSMIRRALKGLGEGKYQPPEIDDLAPRKGALRIIERLSTFYGQDI